MSDTSWKKFERYCAGLIQGQRYWSNSGGKIDVESEKFQGQCKEVAELSLAELTRLVVETERQAEKVGKRGVVFVKLRSGKGNPTPVLVVMTERVWVAKSGDLLLRLDKP